MLKVQVLYEVIKYNTVEKLAETLRLASVS
jgi:hypothetical protein